MKLLFVKTALCAGLLVSTQLHANGTIVINGLIIDGTCTLVGEINAITDQSTPTEITVELDQFVTTNTTTGFFGEKPFTLAFKNADNTANCDTTTISKLDSVSLTSNTPLNTTVTANNVLMNNDTAGKLLTTTRVDIGLFTDEDDEINLANATTQEKSTIVTTTPEKPTISYKAKYYKGGSVLPEGQYVTATANFILNYN
jgi:type 1 fimbria pilin